MWVNSPSSCCRQSKMLLPVIDAGIPVIFTTAAPGAATGAPGAVLGGAWFCRGTTS